MAEPVKEAKADAEEKADEGKSWFSGWFGSDENAEEAVAEPVKEAKADAEEKADEDRSGSGVKSWLNSWFVAHADDGAK